MPTRLYSSWIPKNLSYEKFEKFINESYSYEDTINTGKILDAYPGYSSRLILSSIDSIIYYYGKGDYARAKYLFDRTKANAALLKGGMGHKAILRELSIVGDAGKSDMDTFAALVRRADYTWDMICSAGAGLRMSLAQLDSIAAQLKEVGLTHLALDVAANEIRAYIWSGNRSKAAKLLAKSIDLAKGMGYCDAFASLISEYIDLVSCEAGESRLDSIYGESRKYLSTQKLYSDEGRLALRMAKLANRRSNFHAQEADSLFRKVKDPAGEFDFLLYKLEDVLDEEIQDTNLLSIAESYIRTLDTLRVAAMPGHVSMGEYYRLKAEFNERVGSLKKAESCLILSFVNFRSANEMLKEAEALLRLSTLERGLGKHEESLRYLLMSEKIYEYFRAMDGLARVYCERALVECDLSNIDEARMLLSRADTLLKSLGKVQPPLCVELARARILEDSDELNKALNLRIAIKSTAENMSESIENEIGIARVYLKLGDYKRALAVLNDMETEIRKFKNDRYDVKYNLLRGQVLIKNGEYEKTVSCLEEALRCSKRVELIDDQIWTNYYLSIAYDCLGENTLAINAGREAIELLEHKRASIQTERVKYSFLNKSRTIYRRQISRLLKNSSNREFLLEACYTLSYLKGRVLSEMLGQGMSKGVYYSFVPDSLLEVRDRVSERIQQLQKEARSDAIDEEQLSVLSDRISKAQKEYNELVRQISLFASFETKNQRYKKPLPIFYVQKNLIPDSTAILQYFLDTPRSWVFVITPDTLAVFTLGASEDEISHLVTRVVSPLRNADNYAEINFDVDSSRKLNRILVDPILDLLGRLNIDQLVIQEDASLNLLPFELLVTSGDVAEADFDKIYYEYRKLKFLIDDYVIYYIPSLELLYSGKGEDRSTAEEKLLCIGSPVFNEMEAAFGGGQRRLSELKYADTELKALAQWFDGKLITGKEATESAFKHFAPLYRFVHVATHALFSDSDPLYSHLIFSLSNDSEDGYLQMREIASMNMNAWLVFLNACETGEGKLFQDEGLIGIARAFLYAGCKNIIVNKWRVYDRTSALLAEHFYSNLNREGFTAARALQEAKKELRKEHETINCIEMYYYNPVFWASSVMIGSGRWMKVDGEE